MILWGDRLAGISYPGEIDSLGYHSQGRFQKIQMELFFYDIISYHHIPTLIFTTV